MARYPRIALRSLALHLSVASFVTLGFGFTATAEPVAFQPPPGGPGFPPGPGFPGGPEFPGGPGFLGGPGGPGAQLAALTNLIQIAEVQKEIGLKDDQQKAIDEAVTVIDTARQKAFENFDPAAMFDLEESERAAKFAALGEQMEKANKDAEAILAKSLDSTQFARLKQLSLQRQGIGGLLSPEVSEELKITDQQREKALALQESVMENVFAGGFPPDFSRLEADQRAALAKAIALLDDQQKELWNGKVGKSFEFPAADFMMGGPGGFGPRGPGGPGGPGGPRGPGGPFGPGGPGGGPGGGPMGGERQLVKQFDTDGDERLNATERQAARESIRTSGGPGGRPGGPRGNGPRGGFGPPGMQRSSEPAKPGKSLTPEDVAKFDDQPLYDTSVLRTVFLQFESKDWEAELADFNNTDVEVPATMIVDGKEYPGVGVHFRGMSSYMMVPAGYKRSLNVSVDFSDSKQKLLGYKTLNLLNAHEDASMMSSVLYSQIASKYIPAPKANFVRVVINGENWGIYANVQQFNKEFLKENFKDSDGNRWKVLGSPGGRGGLEYISDDIDDYRRRYQIKSKDTDEAWQDFANLCKVLNKTPTEELPAAIEPILDVDGALWFLALDATLINNDGYWVRASDYSIYQDDKKKFYLVPHDMNEAFHKAMMMGGPGGGRGRGGFGGPGGRPAAAQPNSPNGAPPRGEEASGRGPQGRPNGPGGPGGFGGPGGPGGRGGIGVELDPLVGLDDQTKPLRSKLLAVPKYREAYLQHVREIAEKSLDWSVLGPEVAKLRKLIEDDVRDDTKKLGSFEAFETVTSDDPPSNATGRDLPLKLFAERRRNYLLNHKSIKELGASSVETKGK